MGDGSDDTDYGRSPRIVARPRGDAAMVPKRRPERQEVAGLAAIGPTETRIGIVPTFTLSSDLALCWNDLHR